MNASSRRPFAARLHAVLLATMVLSFLLIAQTFSSALYRIGLMLLIGAALLQVVAGNIPPHWGWARTLRQLVVGLVIVALIFGLGIVLVPYLAQLGRPPDE